ncbi:magnetochrome domain-containing protein [Magnetospira sp. QH-2]|uniref:magnetochrome domain-containing protein n=1 Tax=Magnetospira sp. (strain QH-2) TaxID=1288970 RepID=UPI0003E816C5|nr:magnetochrome domain-containing protein [Magnetospira sp. QH-2]CCQ73003.1 Magnetosome protein MamT [Magnetospira sp. QH-2]
MAIYHKIMEWLAGLRVVLWFQVFWHRTGGKVAVVFMVVVITLGIAWEYSHLSLQGWTDPETNRIFRSHYVGRLDAPTQETFFGGLVKVFAPEPEMKLMAIKRIPRIKPTQPMPHPYVGACTDCHLYEGGPGPGTQYKTPVGALLEQMSKVRKLGPPLRPDSEMPHPPAGRCIKCHDIVVQVPANPAADTGFAWQLPNLR